MSLARQDRLQLDRNDTQEIATGFQQSYAQMDAFIVHNLRLGATIVETGSAAGLDPLSSQKLYGSLANCVANLLKGRDDLVTAHQQAHKIRMRSTQADVHLWGCTTPYGEATGTPEIAVAIAA